MKINPLIFVPPCHIPPTVPKLPSHTNLPFDLKKDPWLDWKQSSRGGRASTALWPHPHSSPHQHVVAKADSSWLLLLHLVLCKTVCLRQIISVSQQPYEAGTTISPPKEPKCEVQLAMGMGLRYKIQIQGIWLLIPCNSYISRTWSDEERSLLGPRSVWTSASPLNLMALGKLLSLSNSQFPLRT